MTKRKREPKSAPASGPRRPRPPASPARSGGWGLLARILILACLGLAVAIIVADSILKIEVVRQISAIQLSDVPPGTTPISPGARERWTILPHTSMDARWWVIHTEEAMRSGAVRLRGTHLDNSPDGREVHWSSGLMWLLSGLAHMLSSGTGRPAVDFVADAALIAGPVMLGLSLLVLSGLIIRRFGWMPAIVFDLVFLCSVPIYLTFQAGEADHHGLVLALATASTFCLIAGGVGFVRRPGASGAAPALSLYLPWEQSRTWFRLSGVFGGAALWVSAATAIPILMACALGACLAAWAGRGREADLRPDLWMSWGIAGALSSLFFYLLEYFPSHMGWRLEVNHPLYALAWLGGAYLLYRFLALLAGEKRSFRGGYVLLGCALISVSVPVLLIALKPGSFFWVSDKFLLSLHTEYIQEFRSLPVTLARSNASLAWLNYCLWPGFALVACVLLFGRKSLSGWGRASLAFVLVPAVAMQCLALVQVRWASAALGLWALCVLVAMVVCLREQTASRAARVVTWGLVACALAAIVFTLFPQVAFSVMQSQRDLQKSIPQEDAGNIILRDIAFRLVQSSPQSLPIVLTGPNSSTELSYHGGLPTLGTLYWENLPGLKRAARVFSVQGEDEALAELQAAKVTHIVVPSWDNFANAYARLLAQAGEGSPTGSAPFFQSIVAGENCPRWLRPLCYPIPSASGLDANSVKIFAVMPDQSPFQSWFYQGVYHFEAREFAAACEMFGRALEEKPGDPETQELLTLARRQRDGQMPRP